tara:strand:+ start:191 stop:3742 length:3552 start_codon:yes stop_codon:yes gene_type:complete
MADTINSVSPDIRDYLLSRNLILSDTVSDNGLTPIAQGLGFTTQITDNANAVQASEDITELSPEIRDGNISRNRYTSNEELIEACIIDNSFSYNQQNGGYLNENRELNIGGPSTEPYDALGSVLNGQGFGLGGDGIESQFDIRSSLGGRVLSAAGLVNDTALGRIAREQLFLALQQKLIFNTQREIFGKVNLQPFSLLRGADFFNPDYQITVKGTLGGKIFDTALNIAGFEIPKSIIDNGASIFSDDEGFTRDSLERNNALLVNTGKGQLLRLFDNLNMNTFKPDYKTDSIKSGIAEPEDYTARPDDIGLVNLNDDGSKYIWGQDDISGLAPVTITNDKNSLLQKTRDLFKNSDEYKSIKTSLGVTPTTVDGDDELTTKMGWGNSLISKGSGVVNGKLLMGESLDDDDPLDRIACRTWSSSVRYDNASSLQKKSGLIKYKNKIRDGLDKSVLGKNGFVKITPYNVPDNVDNVDKVKKYMFSIENLAWNNNLLNLPHFEQGPGDKITGTKGRIMWFPPYGMKFTDTTNVSWDTVKFIGRGEPLYTYNNTERSGTLDFQVIIDHPDYLNDKGRTVSNDILASVAAGCLDYNEFLSVDESAKISNEINFNRKPNQVADTPQTPPRTISFYFPNDSAILTADYETEGLLIETTLTATTSGGYNAVSGTLYDNFTDFGLNIRWNSPTYQADLSASLLNEASFCDVIIKGYASAAGTPEPNQALSEARVASVKQWFLDNIAGTADFENNRIKTESFGDTLASADTSLPVDSFPVKEDRRVIVEFVYDAAKSNQTGGAADGKKENVNNGIELPNNITNRFFREDKYFNELIESGVESDKIIYNNIKDKIDYFQPAFHSTTPEGFNSRLTFLQQCTRQGKSPNEEGSQNLVFGPPPVCILRVGDFYHTKIIINSMAMSYEPLLWDLNPEGVGVQPRIAKITIAFKFIGGSSLDGPINKLQNAVSFNYFANTEIYDPRADKIIKKIDKDGNESYEVKDGVTGFSEQFEGQIYKKPLINKTENEVPAPDPIERAETEIKKPVETEIEVDDTEILNSLFWDVGNDSFGFITLTYTINTGLTKSYDVKLEAILNPTEGISKVLSMNFDSDTGTGGIENSNETWLGRLSQVPEDSNGDSVVTFRVTVSGNGISPIVQNLNRWVGKNSCDSLGFFQYQILDESQNEALKSNIAGDTC